MGITIDIQIKDAKYRDAAEDLFLASLMDGELTMKELTKLITGPMGSYKFSTETKSTLWAAIGKAVGALDSNEPIAVLHICERHYPGKADWNEVITGIMETPYIASSRQTYAKILADLA